MDRVSEYIKTQREARGVTLEQLAKGTLISVAVLKDIEDGKFDKYKGDELYVKMYLKRIGEFLELDTSELVDEYITLTQEIELEDIRKQEELEIKRKQEVKRKNKLSDSLKEMKPSTSRVRRPSKRVYEDNYIARFIKYGVVIALCAVIIFVIWYSIVASQSEDESSYTRPSSGEVETNPNANTDQKTEDKKKKDEEEKDTPNDNGEKEATPGVTLTNVSGSAFDVTGIKAGENLKIEVTFKAQGNFNFWKNNSQVDGAYKVYNIDEVYTYEGVIAIGERYTFNFWNLSNAVIKVNGHVVNYDPATVTVKDGVSYVVLYMKGE